MKTQTYFKNPTTAGQRPTLFSFPLFTDDDDGDDDDNSQYLATADGGTHYG